MKREQGFAKAYMKWIILAITGLIVGLIVIPQYRYRQDKIAAVEIKLALRPLRAVIEAQLVAGTKTIGTGDEVAKTIASLTPGGGMTDRPDVSVTGEITVPIILRGDAGTLTLTPALSTEGAPVQAPTIYWRCTSTVFQRC